MNDVNLIPEDYLRYISLRKTVKKSLLFLLFLVALITGFKVILINRIESEKVKTDHLKYSERKILEKRQSLEELLSEQSELKKRLRILDTLKGGPSVGKMFVAIDKAINPGVWFTEWNFFRTGELSKAPSPGLKKRGYFVVIPKEEAKKGEEFTNFTRMDIKGRALKYSAMADFIKGLLQRKEIGDVFVKKTGKLRNRAESFIEYELSVLIKT
ncbi:MAG: hypothetical protein ACE5FU_06995 [Nitrospinota bacterium]